MECKSIYMRDTCIPMFVAALFTRAKLWNQQKCPTNDEWVKKKIYKNIHIQGHTHTHTLSHIYTMEYTQS
jgi:hypothetical protein